MRSEPSHPVICRQGYLQVMVVVMFLVLVRLVVKDTLELMAIRDLVGLEGSISKQLTIAKAVCESNRRLQETCQFTYIATKETRRAAPHSPAVHE